MTTIICIANQKGGVGKTTTAVNLAYGAAKLGTPTLIIDLDAQGNVADSLNMDPGADLYEWLINRKPLARILTPSKLPLLQVVRSDKTTAMLKMQITGMDFREMVLVKALEEVQHDLVMIDCPPSIDILHTAALVAADYLIIPTRLDQFAIKGVTEVLQSLAAVRRGSPSRCELAGIVPTFFERRTNESHNQLQNLANAFGDYVWPIIPQDVTCRECHRMGKTLWEIENKKPPALYGFDSRDDKRIGGYEQVLMKVWIIGGLP